MTNQQKNEAIAKACGWKNIRNAAPGLGNLGCLVGTIPGIAQDIDVTIPDYGSDLNACHAMEKTIERQGEYTAALARIVRRDAPAIPLSGITGWHFALANATAAQRREAFGITMGLWKEGE